MASPCAGPKGPRPAVSRRVPCCGRPAWPWAGSAGPWPRPPRHPSIASGRILVNHDLTIPGHPDIWVVGDLAAAEWSPGQMVPGVAQGGIQGGQYAARSIIAKRDGVAIPDFEFKDLGELATIGRLRAVADFRMIRFSGFMAWFAWLAIHIFWLIGLQNRILVMVRWAWSFLSRGRGSRLITGLPGHSSDREGKGGLG